MSHPTKSGPWWDDIRSLLDQVSFHDNALAALPGLEVIDGYGRGRENWQARTTERVLERLAAENEEILLDHNGGLARSRRSVEVGRGVLVRDGEEVLFVIEVTEMGDVRAHLEDPPGMILRSAVLTAIAAAMAAVLVVVGFSVFGDDEGSVSIADSADVAPSERDPEVAGITEVTRPEAEPSDAEPPDAEAPEAVAPTTSAVTPPTNNDGATLTATGVLNGTELVLAGSFPSQESIERISEIATSVFDAQVVVDQAVVNETVQATNGGQIVIEEAVVFESGSTVVDARYESVLDQTAAWMQAHPAVTVTVSAHSDDVGTAEFNQLLSEVRAQSVKDYLVDQGADGNRITAVGYGESIPAVPNDAVGGLAENRRIELIVENLLA